MDLAAPQEAMQHFETAFEKRRLGARTVLAGLDPAGAGPAEPPATPATVPGTGHHAGRAGSTAVALAAIDRPGSVRRSQWALLVDADTDAFAATTAALQRFPLEPPTAFRARLGALHAHAAVALGRDVKARRAREAIEIARLLDQADAPADARTTLGMRAAKR